MNESLCVCVCVCGSEWGGVGYKSLQSCSSAAASCSKPVRFAFLEGHSGWVRREGVDMGGGD